MGKISFVVAVLLCLTACTPEQPAPRIVPDQGDLPVFLVVGDSLSAGYGIEAGQGWVNLLQDRLAAEGFNYNVVNASVSGDTTSGGLARLESALPRLQPEIVVIELGANDGLRGIQLPVIEKNLKSMVEKSLDAGARVALLGMRIPSNYGPRYADQFHDLYDKVAKHHGIPLVEFFLDGVALNPRLMLPDRIHPNAAAQPRLLDNAWPAIEAALNTN